ncbi:MAG: hypothetical protein Q8R37_05120, partial [Nanoarchaeota archaeon]|nr:hypothetical protein [Nanoarchaeota archaeon]
SLGMTQIEGSKYAGISVSTFQRYQVTLGLERWKANKTIPEYEISRISEIRKTGKKLKEIAEITGYSMLTVRKYLAKERKK